ncbi:MAG: hypothetical protein ACYCO9_10130 [Streptosporangiaceae bacterium]
MNQNGYVLRAGSYVHRLVATLALRLHQICNAAGRSAAEAPALRRLSRRERVARAAIGMPPGHPELLTRKPGRAEWRHLAAWITELWPRDEYTAIVTEELRRDHP